MTYDPSAARSGAIPTTNPTYQAAWICYINGVEVPIVGFEVNCGVWKIPSFSIDLIPDILLQRLGQEDRIPVQLFYLDYWYDPEHPEFRLLVDGEIVGWRYSSSSGNRTMSFSCLAHIHVFQQLYFFYMTNVDDIVAARDPTAAVSGFSESGLLYPYSLFHQGLIVTEAQVQDARPATRNRHGADRLPRVNAATVTRDDQVKKPIQAPYELIYNVVKGVISKDVPADRRAIPMMNFFARHMRKTRFQNRFVRLPYLEDAAEIGEKQGVFPIFQAARNEQAINAMQRQTASQIGNSGPVWNVLEQIYSMVYMDIAMIPNPAAVRVKLDDPGSALGNRDGEIIGLLTHRDAIVNRTPQQPDGGVGATTFETPAAPQTIGAPIFETPAFQAAANEGTPGNTPVRLAQYFIKPQMYFSIPPHCNVIFPSMVTSWTYDEPYLTQPTRIYVNDSVMTHLLRTSGTNQEFMLHALTVAFPEEANAILEHKTGGATHHLSGAPTMAESGKNLLIWPEEFYKGPVTAKLALPSWFQMLRQFSNGRGGGAPNTPATNPTDSGLEVVGTHAKYLFRSQVIPPTGGQTFHGRTEPATGRLHAGTDFFGPLETPIHALFDGVVVVLDLNFQKEGMGNALTIRYPAVPSRNEQVLTTSPYFSVYMHLKRFGDGITVGARVTKGQIVGYIGNSNGNNKYLNGAADVAPTSANAHGRRGSTGIGSPEILDTLQIFGLAEGPPAQRTRTDALVAAAQAATDSEACERLLEEKLTHPVGALPAVGAPQRVKWPWSAYFARTTPPNQGWRKIARAIGGFMLDSGPHCHVEIIMHNSRNSLLKTSTDRVDPIRFLQERSIEICPNRNLPGANRRGRRTRTTATPLAPTNTNLSDEAVSEGALTSDPDAVPGALVTPGTTAPGVAPTTAPNPAVPAPGGTTPPTAAPAVRTNAVVPPAPVVTYEETLARVHRAQGLNPSNNERGPRVIPPFTNAAAELTAFNFERRRQNLEPYGVNSGTLRSMEQNVNESFNQLARLNAELVALHLPTVIENPAVLDVLPEDRYIESVDARITAINQEQRGGAAATPVAPTSGSPVSPISPNAATGANTTEPDPTFQELFKLYARHEYLKQRYIVRQAAIQLAFNPYLIPGFPSMMFDSMRTRFHTVGYMQNISHSASAANGGSISTQAQLTCCRTLPEFINDVSYDAEAFHARVIAAPAEIIDQIRLRMQDQNNAENFYRRLLFGEGNRYNGVGAAFVWTDALEYSRGAQGDPIILEGVGLADAHAQDHPSTAPQTSTQTEARVVQSNLDPDRELSPRENVYGTAFDSYHIAMQLASRPACSLEQYIRFWHGGMTLNDLIRQGAVHGENKEFEYNRLASTDVIRSETNAEGENTNVRGPTSRSSAAYYSRIYKLRQGPGEDLPAPAPPGNHRKPPTDAQQGFTAARPIQPSLAHEGLPGGYPQTRANWDLALEQYREKVRTRLRPNT
jgi:Peptidase family M23